MFLFSYANNGLQLSCRKIVEIGHFICNRVFEERQVLSIILPITRYYISSMRNYQGISFCETIDYLFQIIYTRLLQITWGKTSNTRSKQRKG